MELDFLHLLEHYILILVLSLQFCVLYYFLSFITKFKKKRVTKRVIYLEDMYLYFFFLNLMLMGVFVIGSGVILSIIFAFIMYAYLRCAFYPKKITNVICN